MKFGLALTVKGLAINLGGVERLLALGGDLISIYLMTWRPFSSVHRCWCKNGFKRNAPGGSCIKFCPAIAVPIDTKSPLK
jgi:hypothetical protein